MKRERRYNLAGKTYAIAVCLSMIWCSVPADAAYKRSTGQKVVPIQTVPKQSSLIYTTRGACSPDYVCVDGKVAPLICAPEKEGLQCHVETVGQVFDVYFKNDGANKYRSPTACDENNSLCVHFMLWSHVDHPFAYNKTKEVVQTVIRMVGFKQRYHIVSLITNNTKTLEKFEANFVWAVQE